MASLLTRLELQPDQLAALPVDVGERVVDFLLRWQSYAEALACLEHLPDLAHGASPGAIDARAAALHGLGRTDAAIARLEQRIAEQDNIPARIQLARLYLAAGRIDEAAAIARALPGGDRRLGPGVYLHADVLLAAGKAGEAEALLLQQIKAAPASRQPLVALMRVQTQRRDVVAASAYAMQALDHAARGPELSVEEMNDLRLALNAVGDAARVRELNHKLIERFDRDVATMQALVANAKQMAAPRIRRAPALPAPPAAVAPTPAPSTATQPLAPAAPAPTVGPALPPATPTSPAAAFSSVPVSAKERKELARSAREFFGYPSLLPGQAEVLACVLRGEDVLAVMPTGAGKSLCYQLPAFVGQGVTLVVSPLVALMKDQIDGLPEELHKHAIAVHGSLEGDSLRRITERIARQQYKLVYIAPERLRQRPFIQALQTAGLSRLVVDEAHCVSIWGHDFRPDYLHIVRAHRDLGSPPVLAITATAPERVRHDIERQLLGGERPMRVLVGEVFRPNLRLTAVRVRDEEEQQQALVAVLQQVGGSGIIYARSRQRCEEIATFLAGQGVAAAAYHAGLPDRTVVQDRFMRNDLAVIVATVAFGMGIDKRDIRFIVHCGLPSSLEGYYQEIGRAGRDGGEANCVLIYSAGDHTSLTRLAARGQITAETVNAVYGALRQLLAGRTTGLAPFALLAPAIQGDARGAETQARVVLGVLEQVGLVRRDYDAPQSLTVQRLPQTSGRKPDPALADFFRRAGLEANPTAVGDFADLAHVTGIPLEALEPCLVAWQAAGWLRYFPTGRAPLVTLLPAPANVQQRIDTLLAQRVATAQQRVQEIHDFAASRTCRHAYLAQALGSGLARPCGVCDNCGDGIKVKLPSSGGQDPAAIVLAALADQSCGRRSLIRLLRGDPEASERARESVYFGALHDRSEQSLGQLIDSLLAENLIQTRALDHGGVTLEPAGYDDFTARKPTKPRTGTSKWR